MTPINHKLSAELQKVLINNTYFQALNNNSRQDLLVNCGLGKYCHRITLDKKSSDYISSIFSQFIQINIYEKPALIIFLEYILILSDVNFDFSSQEQQLIKLFIEQLERNYRYNNLLTEGRNIPPPVQQPLKVDRGIIVNYDLEILMSKFRQEVRQEGAFAFAVKGEHRILEEYIIERIQRELKLLTGRPNVKLEIRLCPESISTSSIENKFLNKYNYQDFPELFNTECNPDILLIIWNHNDSKKYMDLLALSAQSFWQNISPSLLPCLIHKSRCFVIIWANVGKYLLSGFTVLKTPNNFQLEDLEPWFRGQLRMIGIEATQIEKYLKRLRSQSGDLTTTYLEMKDILQELGGTRRYG
ncbi:hypothetical protein NSTC745_02448 [Nostoc sp. DSM 114161]|jgi:hypothetical protein|uniref:hypothetical protein n=1 Tax=Nostoc sp. DSM 114161 TaxID=3440143 RepID=UPI004045A8D4